VANPLELGRGVDEKAEYSQLLQPTIRARAAISTPAAARRRVLVSFPFTDISFPKRRPALVPAGRATGRDTMRIVTERTGITTRGIFADQAREEADDAT
jgi:hypothetical protein